MKTLLPVVAVLAVAAACASSGSTSSAGGSDAPKRGSRYSATCPLAIDSMFLGRGPVYRACDVDVAARPNPTTVHPDFTPSMRDRCMSADFDFVVGADGIPEADAVKLVSTNNSAYADAVRRIIPALRYTPATKNGVAVRQLTRYSTIVNVVVGTGAAMTPPSTPMRC